MLYQMGETEEAEILETECIESSRSVHNLLHLTLLGNKANRKTIEENHREARNVLR